jgi:hypothetical protein
MLLVAWWRKIRSGPRIRSGHIYDGENTGEALKAGTGPGFAAIDVQESKKVMRFLEWWRGRPAFIRIPIALAIMDLATCVFLAPPAPGTRGSGGAAGLIYAVGLILLFTGPTDAQKKGYHD